MAVCKQNGDRLRLHGASGCNSNRCHLKLLPGPGPRETPINAPAISPSFSAGLSGFEIILNTFLLTNFGAPKAQTLGTPDFSPVILP